MTRLTIDDLEILTPDEIGQILYNVIRHRPMDIEYVMDCINFGACLELLNEENRTPIFYAIMNDLFWLTDVLIQHNCNINAIDYYRQTPLFFALLRGEKYIKLLLNAGADVRISNRYGETAWDIATKEIREAIPELEPK